MAGRSFEELVREEMDGLRIKPGEEVWRHLAAALEQKKKKRWLFWLFSAGVGCLCLSSTWYISTRADLSTDTKPGINVPASTPHIKTGKTKLETATPLEAPIQVLKDLQAGYFPNEGTGAGKSRSTALLAKEIPAVTLQVSDTQQAAEPGKIAENTTIARELTSGSINRQHASSTSMPLLSLTPLKDTSFADPRILDTIPITMDTDPGNRDMQQQIGKSVTRRWQLSLAVNVGRSGMRTGIGKTPEYPGILSANIPAFPGAAASWRTPSLQDAGSFGLNAEFSKLLRKHAGISLQIGYQLYRTQMGVGKKIDSSLQGTVFGTRSGNGAYYLSSDSTMYLNHFHFLQAGVSGYLQYPLSAKMQVRWNLGAAAAVLIRSNALHYDAATGVLYTNNALLNRFQWNFFSGVELGLGKQPVIYIGPEWSWFVTTPYQQGVNTEQHLFRSALKARVILGRKNKK